MPPVNMTSSSSNIAFNSNNPVPALIARRTTVLAPPSLSTVNHLDGAIAATASSSSSSTPASAANPRPSINSVSTRRHRPDLQQAVSQPTAAVPVSTHENISTSKSWFSGLHLGSNAGSSASTVAQEQRRSSGGAGGGDDAQGFAVHPTFRSDAESRGDVLVRVDGVEFWVHKDVLLFSSPFFKSVLEGGWSESRLSRLVNKGEADAVTPAHTLPMQQEGETHDAAINHLTGAHHVSERSTRSLDREAQAQAQPHQQDLYRPDDRVDVTEESASEHAVNHTVELESGLLGVAESQRSSLLRASYHTALWSQDDESRGSQMHFHDTTEDSLSVDSDANDVGSASEDGSASEGALASEADQAVPQQKHTPDGDRDAVSAISAHQLRQRRSKTKHLATLRKLEAAQREKLIPTRSTSRSLDTACKNEALVETGAQQRLESLATPPLSRRASGYDDALGVPVTAPEPNTEAAAESMQCATSTVNSSSEDRHRAAALPAHYQGIISVIDLTEETASTFHDFLFHIYPHLDLFVTWYNCGPLLRFSDKFQVPFLRRSCIAFLRAALAGRPIEAMRLAELHGIDDLYRQASRHVLDNFAAWLPDELAVLSHETLLKLERKRTWFLERLLKLGLANPARDYECHAACPDPQACARALHDKWQTAYKAAFRFSPPQPSVIFRYLRELDSIGVGINASSGVSSAIGSVTGLAGGAAQGAAPLQLSNCQATARVWVQGLFDRMFELGTLHTGRLFLAIKLDPSVTRNVVHMQ